MHQCNGNLFMFSNMLDAPIHRHLKIKRIYRLMYKISLKNSFKISFLNNFMCFWNFLIRSIIVSILDDWIYFWLSYSSNAPVMSFWHKAVVIWYDGISLLLYNWSTSVYLYVYVYTYAMRLPILTLD